MSILMSSGTEDAASDGGRVEVTMPQIGISPLFLSVFALASDGGDGGDGDFLLCGDSPGQPTLYWQTYQLNPLNLNPQLLFLKITVTIVTELQEGWISQGILKIGHRHITVT